MKPSPELPQIGDRVRFRECNLRASGVIVEDLTDDYVKVQWSDWMVPTTHRRHSLELDDTQMADAALGY